MEPEDFKHLPLKIRQKTVYNVGVSSQDAPFFIRLPEGGNVRVPEKSEKER